MNKLFDFTKQVFNGKSIGRIIFNWQVGTHCRDLSGRYLDLASGQNPSYLHYWSFLPLAELIRTDYREDKGFDLSVDFNLPLPFESGSFDGVFFFNAVYITRDPKKTLSEIRRVLKPDGRLFMSSPFIFNEAREPDDFRRLTSQGLEDVLRSSGFEKFLITSYGERFSAVAHLLHSFFIFNLIRFFVFAASLFFDRLIPKRIKMEHPCPAGYFVVAEKTSN